MTFRQPTNLSVLGKTTSIFSTGKFESSSLSQLKHNLLAAGVVTAGLMGVFTFGVGAWTIGGWVFGSDTASVQTAEISSQATTSAQAGTSIQASTLTKSENTAEPESAPERELVVRVSDDSDQNSQPPEKPEITQTAALNDVAGVEEKIDNGEEATDSVPAGGSAAATASNITAQFAEALAGVGDDTRISREDSIAFAMPTLDADGTSTLEPRTVTVSRGDTLMGLMVGAGAGRSDAHEAITALRDVYSPRRLRPGQDIELVFAPISENDEEEANAQGSVDDTAGGGQLMGMSLQSAVDEIVRVARAAASDDFVAETIARPLDRQVLHGSGTIDSSLFVAARNANIPNSVMIELMRAFSYDVDFQREIQPGDKFDLLYEAFYDEDGKMAKTGNILVASLTLSGTPLNLYGFTPSSGFTDFFDEKGQAVRKALLRTPVDGARLSSGFGRRKHPILGYTRMHKGLDFAAPRGTPIYAAGDGVIERAGRNGSYGKYVRIRHHSSYKTAYAHMKGFAKGVKKGKRVKQGQVIGYVGTTGRSTGPHLHYEVLRDNKQVNPRKIKLPAGEKLKKKDLKNFQSHRAEIDQLREDVIARNAQMVQAKPADCKAQRTVDESGSTTADAASADGC
ncbi:M23 family metallopeptidase [Pelagibius sp. Alg239-R121]|uniref:M23 family metallopeptidase n=1 Tax=Pelagibius sp. Alg239-R121 TaxID=2993448 RepID=UPI0024A6AACC|nr:M23 family metallopeptidase [Pelagibius sp. Alg239-R121]